MRSLNLRNAKSAAEIIDLEACNIRFETALHDYAVHNYDEAQVAGFRQEHHLIDIPKHDWNPVSKAAWSQQQVYRPGNY